MRRWAALYPRRLSSRRGAFVIRLVGDPGCDEQLATGGVLLHPCGDVDRVAESGEVDHRAPHVAHECDARIDRYSQLEPRSLGTAVANRVQQVDPSLDGAASVVGDR